MGQESGDAQQRLRAMPIMPNLRSAITLLRGLHGAFATILLPRSDFSVHLRATSDKPMPTRQSTVSTNLSSKLDFVETTYAVVAQSMPRVCLPPRARLFLGHGGIR